MRRLLLLFTASTVSSFVASQARNDRFIEVQVTDTVQLSFAGLDYEVRIPSPFDLAGPSIPEDYNEKGVKRAIDDGAAKAKELEARFLAIVKEGGSTHRLASTEQVEDYAYGTDRKFDMNTYVVQLKDPAEMERFFKAIEGTPELVGNIAGQHFGDPSLEAPRLMRKLHDHARIEAEALAAVAGVRLGSLISVQEVERNESSILEQLFLMERSGEEEVQRRMASTHSTTMAFRFEMMAP